LIIELAALLIYNLGIMRNVLLVREIYIEAFKNLGNFLIKNYLKVFAWFCFVLIAVASYALIFRISTGYAFQ
jgi:hypothetical protein